MTLQTDDFDSLVSDDDFDSLLDSKPGSILDRPITVTWFKSDQDVRKDERETTVRQLAKKIAKSRGRTKADLRAVKFARFGDRPTNGEAGRALRNNENVLAVTGIESDHDAGTISLDEAESRIRGARLGALLVSTSSHRADEPHWRAFFPLSREVEPAVRAALAARINGIFDGDLDQHATFTLSQLQYVGAVEGGLPIETRLIDGRGVDLADDLDVIALPKGSRRTANGSTAMMPTDEDGLLDLISSGEVYHPAFISLAGKFARRGDSEADAVSLIRNAMLQVPADQQDGRWRHRLKDLPATVADIFAKEAKRVSRERDDYDDVEELPAALPRDALEEEAENPVTRRLNRRHAVVVTGGRTVVTTEGRDGSIAFGTVRDIHAFYENDQVTVAKGKTEAASKRWMRDPERRTFRDGVTFAPGGCSPTMLNLWRGWAVEPDPAASCERFLNHLRHVVCNGDAEQSTYLLGWLAHMVQRPDEKPGVAIVLRGAKGAGKDTLADYVSLLIGRRHARTVAESSHITGKFNARLENTLLLHVQEGSWAGDRKSEGVLKYLVTSDHVEIERKGIDSINLPSVLRMFISANAEWVVPASADERRWAIYEVSDRRRGDEAYFTALRAEMNGNGPAALLHYLQNYDLTGFNVRKAPETEGLRNQKIASLRNIDLWWFEMLNRGTLSEFEDGDGWSAAVQLVGCQEMRRRYLEWMKGRRFDGEAVEERHFGRRMSDMLPEIKTRRPSAKPGITRIRQYEVPALADCRAAFDQWLGQPVDWEAEE